MQAIQPWMPIIVSVATAIVVAGLGGWFTRLGPWYRNLKKPSWQPPDWLFGPAWSVIFALAATSAVMSWDGATTDALRSRVVILFVANAVLNLAWSPLFFRLERPDWAMVEVVFLWLSIVALIVGLWPISWVASVLILPYFVWVSFASYLNLTIIRLNAPFGVRARSAAREA